MNQGFVPAWFMFWIVAGPVYTQKMTGQEEGLVANFSALCGDNIIDDSYEKILVSVEALNKNHPRLKLLFWTLKQD